MLIVQGQSLEAQQAQRDFSSRPHSTLTAKRGTTDGFRQLVAKGVEVVLAVERHAHYS